MRDRGLPIAVAAIVLAVGLSIAGALSPLGQATAGASANSWQCSSGDSSGDCASSPLTPLPEAAGPATTVTAPCPESQDTCIYVWSGSPSVQAFDTSNGDWMWSDDSGQCTGLPACAPMAQAGAAVAAAPCPQSTDTCMYVLGGTQGQTPAANIEVYDTSNNRWTSSDSCSDVTLCLPFARVGAGATTAECPHSNDRCLYVLGGNDSLKVPSKTVQVFDPSTGRWDSSDSTAACSNAALPCLPVPIQTASASGGSCPQSQDWCVYVHGTNKGSTAPATLAFDPTTAEWVSASSGSSCAPLAAICAPLPIAGSAFTTAACVNDEAEDCLYLIGGSLDGSTTAIVQMLNPLSGVWTSSGSSANDCQTTNQVACLPTSRQDAGASVAPCFQQPGDCVYVAGGFDASGVVSALESYSPIGPGANTTLYVSPLGSDTNPGTYFYPLKSLAAAQDHVRGIDMDMTTGIDVELENGTYRLSHTLTFAASDGGTNGYKVTWMAAPGERPIISGATRVTGWARYDAKRNIWSAPVAPGTQTRQIYVNGSRARMTTGAIPAGLTQIYRGYRASNSVMAHWRNPSELEMAYSGTHMCFGNRCPDDGVGRWTWSECHVQSIHGTTIVMAQPCWFNSTRRVYNYAGHQDISRPDYVQNAFELLDSPGQFYIDDSQHRLYYIPRSSENLATADVEMPTLQRLVIGRGSPDAPIHDLAFTGIQFAYATWNGPSSGEGFSEVQAGMTITGRHGYQVEGLCKFAKGGTCPYGNWTKEPGNVDFRYTAGLSFVDDGFIHLGAAGLNLDDGTQDATVEGCIFSDISGNALELGGFDHNLARGSDATTYNLITQNRFWGVPTEFYGNVAILAGYVSNTTISHNDIDHTPYTAISIGWAGWPERRKLPPLPNNSHDNVIADNLIQNVLERESDGGGIYNQGATGTSFADGQDVTGNVVTNSMLWGRGIQSDQGVQWSTYTNNVMVGDYYDFGPNHLDWAVHTGDWDPLRVLNNYWQEIAPDSTARHVAMEGNKDIPSLSDAPRSIVENAGVTGAFTSLSTWRPAEATVPDPPGLVGILYAFSGKAYVAWEPSLDGGSQPVVSYTLACDNPAIPPVTVSEADFLAHGYALVTGLTIGRTYRFRVVANSSAGPSAPSPYSRPATVAGVSPPLTRPPKQVATGTTKGAVALMWYAASTPHGMPPVLGFDLTGSNGIKATLSGPTVVEEGSRSGRLEYVFSNLTSGKKYRFSISELTPAGQSDAVWTPWVTAG